MNTCYPQFSPALAAAGRWPYAALPGRSGGEPLEEVVVTSSRVPMPLRQVGTSISVITQEEIAQLGFSSLYDVLRTQPAVSVTNTGGAGSATALRIRGEEGYRTLVLLDGIDISDTSGAPGQPALRAAAQFRVYSGWRSCAAHRA